MLNFIFTILMLAVFGKLALIAIKMTWGIFKVLLTLVFLPFIIIGAFLSGLVVLAFPLLIIVGLCTLFVPFKA